MTISNTARDSDMRMKTSMHDVNFKEQTHEINLEGVPALKEEPYAEFRDNSKFISKR